MRLAWRNLFHDPVRLLVTVAGIAFAVFLMIFEGSLLAGFLKASSEVIDASEADLWVAPRGTPAFDFPSPLPERFRSMAAGVPGVEAVDRVAAGFATWLRPDGTRQGVIVIGTDPGVGTAFPRPLTASGTVDMPESAVVDESDLDLLGLTVTPTDAEIENRRCRVTGTVSGFGSFLGSPYVFTSHRDAVRYLGLGTERTTYLLCRVKAGHDVTRVQHALAARLPETDVWTRSEFARRSRTYWVLQTGAGGAILTAALLGFIVGVVIVSQTIYATTMENLEEFATLRAMGATRRFLCRIVLIQAVVGGIAGYSLGLLASLPTLALLRGAIAWVHTPWWMPLGMLAASLVMGAVASLTSIRTVVTVEPGEFSVREGLHAEGLTHTYGSGAAAVHALRDVSLEFEPGKLQIVMGPSGSGKTTLLMVMGFLLTPDSGRIRLGSRSISGLPETERATLRRRHVGFIFQAFRLFRSLSALENVLVALEIDGRRGGEARSNAMAALEAVGIPDRAARRPHELSGGEKQRVAIARAIVTDPDILFADEPTAALDSESGRQVTEILRSLAVDQGRMVVAVSHDPRLMPYAHRTIALRDGAVVEIREANA